jgi:hypothetical protein
MINNEKKLKKVIRDIVKESTNNVDLRKMYLPPDKQIFTDNKYSVTKDEYLYADEPVHSYQKFCLVGPVEMNGRNRYLLSLDNNKYMLEYQNDFYSQKMSSEDFVYTNLNAVDISIITEIPINIIHKIHYDYFNLSNSPNVEFAKNSLILNVEYAPAYYGAGNYVSDKITVSVNKPNIDLSIPSLLKTLATDTTIWTKDSFAPNDYQCSSKRRI